MGIVQRAVEAAELHQLVMRAAFDHAPVLEDENQVGVLHGGQPVRDHEAGASAHQLVHRLLDFDFRPRIDVARRFVQNEHARVRQHCARDGDELPLALGDVHAVVGKHRIVSVRQPLDVRIDPRGFRRRAHLLHRRVLASVDDVIKNRAAEKPGVLQNHRIRAAQRIAPDVADFIPVDQNAAAVDVIKAHQQVNDGRLPRAGRADDGDRLAGLGVDRKRFQDGLLGRIAEVDVFHLYPALHVR